MSKVAGFVLVMGAGGLAYLAWRDKEIRDLEAQQIAQQRAIEAQRENDDWWASYGQQQGGGNSLLASIAAPFITQGVGLLGDAIFNKSNTSSGGGTFWDKLFGRKPNGSTGAPAQIGTGGGVVQTSTGRPQTSSGGTAPLRDLIGSVEAPKGYGQVYGGVKLQPPKPIETMTVAEVMDWQRQTVNAGSPSSAAGKYQIIGPTLRGLVDQGAVSPYDRFDANTQDRLADTLLKRRGLDQFRAGQISETQFAQNLSMEWASFPVATKDKRGRPAAGQSYYAGDGLNKSLTSLDRVLSAIRKL